MNVSPGTEQVLSTLVRAGHSAYVVGGAVRDLLSGRVPADFDVATSARPDEVMALFPHTIPTGVAFGGVTVPVGEERIEVTTYRADGAYRDGRRPESVRFSADIGEDLLRRDFTIGAMALSPDGTLIDPTGGRADLAAHLIRAVGDPAQRFSEDALRILRAARFSATLDFTIEPATLSAALECAPLLQKISGERIARELSLLLLGPAAERVIRTCHPILDAVLPGLSRLAGLEMHNPAHAWDVLTHTAKAVAAGPADPLLRLTLLLHDIGKPYCYSVDEDGRGHFFGHADRGAELAAALLPRLRLPRRDTAEMVALIRDHQFPFSTDRTALNLQILQFGPEHFRRLLLVRAADVLALRPGMEEAAGRVLAALDTVDDILTRGIWRVGQLALSGRELAFLPPAQRGRVLSLLLTEVIESKLPNTRAALTARAAELGRDMSQTGPSSPR